jgi:Uncharacterized conserved protein (DUF2303)
MTESRSEAQPIIEAIERNHKPWINSDVSSRTLPDGTTQYSWRDAAGEMQHKDIPPCHRARGTVSALTVAGFAEALEHQSSGSTRKPLVEFLGNKVRAAINPAMHDMPGPGDHAVELDPDLSSDWIRWRDFCRDMHRRRRAAEFIEDNAADFMEATGGTTPHGTLLEWAQRLSLKAYREIEQSDTEDGDHTTLDGTATMTHVTWLALRVFDGGPVIGFRCRWRAGLDDDGKLSIGASVVNAADAVRRLWIGPAPDGADWTPLVDQIEAAIGHKVIV